MAPERSDHHAAVTVIAIDAVRERAPTDVEVVPFEETPDLSAVDFIVPTPATGARLDELPTLTRLRVVQVLSAGTDRVVPYLPPQATLCNARSARDGPVAEWILGALLGASTGLLEYAGATTWDRSRSLDDLGSWTVLDRGNGLDRPAVGDVSPAARHPRRRGRFAHARRTAWTRGAADPASRRRRRSRPRSPERCDERPHRS